MKNFNLNSFFLGAIVVLLAVLAFRSLQEPAPVHADTAIGPGLTAVALTQNNFDYLAVIDEARHLSLYQPSQSGLKLLCTRTLEYDLKLDFYNNKGFTQNPEVAEIKKLLDQ